MNKIELITRNFVNSVITRIANDKACRAAFHRADNPAMEYQSWEYLADYSFIDLTAKSRLAFATIASAIAKAGPIENGSSGIGRLIASCYKKDNNDDQAKAKLRRLLVCETLEDVCRILRSIFSLIRAKSSLHLDFANLLKDLLIFENNSLTTKARWAQDFYRGD